MNYLYNGLKLPEPPLGFSGHILLMYDKETSQYVVNYGSFYAYNFFDIETHIVVPYASLPTCYALKAGMTKWSETTLMPDGTSEWIRVASPDEYIWTNMDICLLDREGDEPTAEVAYQGTAAQIVPDDPEPDPEPAKDSRPVSMLMGYMVGQAIRK